MLITQLLVAAVTFLSPVRFDVTLAGNFGEPRPDHFHGGLDVKTNHVEGKPIHAIGDGFVTRVVVSANGYGNAIFVRHPNGYTSVYAHLQKFAPQIEAKVRKAQYQRKNFEVDVHFEAAEFPITKGQVIALSGNTGNSFGPHLHLEIHETDTWNMRDPLELIPDLMTDEKAPKARAIMACPCNGMGAFNGADGKQIIELKGDSIQGKLTAWGKVGFAIQADDFMQGVDNKYGIRFTTLKVDGKEVFSSNVDNIPVADNKLVNLWGDLEYYQQHKEWFMKSFVEEGNTLSILKTDANKGYILFNEERDYHLQYVLADFFGNKRAYHFVVRGEKIAKDQVKHLTPKEKDEEKVKEKPAPVVIPVDKEKWAENKRIIVEVKDRASREVALQGFVDGQFVLFEPQHHSSRYVCQLRHSPLKPSKASRQLTIMVKDTESRGATFKEQFIY